MNIDEQDELEILRKINKEKDKEISQRSIAKTLGFSLGKLNYCLNALKDKGLIKFKNFKKNKNKQNYLYIITPKGMAHKSRLTINFMKRKMKEYDELKKEIDKEKL